MVDKKRLKPPEQKVTVSSITANVTFGTPRIIQEPLPENFPKLTYFAEKALIEINKGSNEILTLAREMFRYMVSHREEWEKQKIVIRDWINESVVEVSFKTGGSSWYPDWQKDHRSLEPFFLIADLFHTANRQPERLKLCSISTCDELFWDESPNRIREICAKKICARERHRLTVAAIRENMKKMASARLGKSKTKPAAKTAKTKRRKSS